MPQFLMTYRGPKGYTPTTETTPLWRAWFDSMGDQLVDLGQPARGATAVGNCSSETTELDGYSIIEAENLDSARAMARGCPHLRWNGGVEVAAVVDLSAS